MLAIGSNGSISVARHTDSDVKQVCSHNIGPGITAPVVVAVVAEDGRGTSARIEIVEVARGRVQ